LSCGFVGRGEHLGLWGISCSLHSGLLSKLFLLLSLSSFLGFLFCNKLLMLSFGLVKLLLFSFSSFFFLLS
jgi:hypothetical protein